MLGITGCHSGYSKNVIQLPVNVVKIWVWPKAIFFRLVKCAVFPDLHASFPSSIKKAQGKCSAIQIKSHNVFSTPFSPSSPSSLENKQKQNERK